MLSTLKGDAPDSLQELQEQLFNLRGALPSIIRGWPNHSRRLLLLRSSQTLVTFLAVEPGAPGQVTFSIAVPQLFLYRDWNFNVYMCTHFQDRCTYYKQSTLHRLSVPWGRLAKRSVGCKPMPFTEQTYLPNSDSHDCNDWKTYSYNCKPLLLGSWSYSHGNLSAHATISQANQSLGTIRMQYTK